MYPRMPKWAWIGIVAIILSVSGWSMMMFHQKAESDAVYRFARTMEAARVAFADRQWPEAERQYTKVVEADPEDKLAWYCLGVAKHYQGKHAEARADYQRAGDLGFEPAMVAYNMACSHSVDGNAELALKYLGEALRLGFDDYAYIAEDPDFDPIREMPEFRALTGSN